MEIITRNEKILYIGIDVHKDIYSLCSYCLCLEYIIRFYFFQESNDLKTTCP